MSWIENEVTFANSLIFDHSVKCADFIKDIFSDLAIQLSTQLDLPVDIKFYPEEPVTMPKQVLPPIISSSDLRGPELSPQQPPKRHFNFTPSPTRKSPDRKKLMVTRPVAVPSFKASLRAPLREVSDNATPKKVKSGDSSVTSTRGSYSQGSHSHGSAFQSPKWSSQRSQYSPQRPSSQQSLHLSPQRSPKPPQTSPQRPQHASQSHLSVGYPKLDAEPLSSKPVSRLLMPTAASLQHASPSKKVQPSVVSTTSSPKKLCPPLPKPALTSASTEASSTLLLNNPIRPVHSKIPVSINSADATLPLGYSAQTPFRVGLKKPLPRPIVAPSPSQITLPDISDNDSGASLLRSWAATPEITRQLQNQGLIDPMTVFGTVEPLEIDKVFAKPRVLKGRPRTSSAAWEHDGVTIKERKEFAKEMGWE